MVQLGECGRIANRIIRDWWESLPRKTRGGIAGGLVLLENLHTDFTLEIAAHKAEGSDQLKNATAANVQKILAEFGESRLLVKEGGRTNRGLVKSLTPLLRNMRKAGLHNLSLKERNAVLREMQAFLAEKAKDELNAKKITFAYRKGMTSREVIGGILAEAAKRKKAGEIAEYMVGAKLALRFPNQSIRNTSASAADEQTAEPGDFKIHDSVFHATVSPNRGHYDKCRVNLDNGPARVFACSRRKAGGDSAVGGSRLGKPRLGGIHRVICLSKHRGIVGVFRQKNHGTFCGFAGKIQFQSRRG